MSKDDQDLATTVEITDEAIANMLWFARYSTDAEVQEWVTRSLGNALRAVLDVAKRMHADVPGNSLELHQRLIGAAHDELLGKD